MERKLTAIFCADVFGYSRLTGENEEATHRTLKSYRKLIDALIEQHRGRFVHSAGDKVGFVCIFSRFFVVSGNRFIAGGRFRVGNRLGRIVSRDRLLSSNCMCREGGTE